MFGKKSQLILLVFQVLVIALLILNLWVGVKIALELNDMGEQFRELRNERIGVNAISLFALLFGMWNVRNLLRNYRSEKRAPAATSGDASEGKE